MDIFGFVVVCVVRRSNDFSLTPYAILLTNNILKQFSVQLVITITNISFVSQSSNTFQLAMAIQH